MQRVKPARTLLRVGFDGALKLEFHGCKVTSDAGLLPYRELDDVVGLTAIAEGLLHDWRTGQNTRDTMVGLLRQSTLLPSCTNVAVAMSDLLQPIESPELCG